MSVPLIVNGVTYNYPQQFDTGWGPVLTAWSTAVTNGMLQTSGVNTASFIASSTVLPASAGVLRLAKTDSIGWKNNAGSGNLLLAINGSNQLTFNGVAIGATAALTQDHIYVGNASNQPTDVAMSGDATIVASGALTIANLAINNAKVANAAAIAVNKLAALTASQIVTSDGSGFLTTTASPTLTELGYLAGVTSAIQTQLNTLTSSLGSYLPLAGGTMSGAIAMGSHKVTGLTSGSTSGDALAYGQSGASLSGLAVGSQKITGLANGTASTDAVAFGQIVAPTIQTFTSGSGTYTPPSSPRAPLYLRVRMIAGGGGGSGSSTLGGANGGSGGTGGNTTFGTSLLTTNGGVGAVWSASGSGAAGGTASLAGGAIGIAMTGASGGGPSVNNANGDLTGSAGAGSPFAGPTISGGNSSVGANGVTNSGTGGQGGGTQNVNSMSTGSGGGAGGYIDAIVPSASYSYAVGSVGSAGSAGASGFNGGTGGSGYIEVIEYYQ
jgi:hypothetical protein